MPEPPKPKPKDDLAEVERALSVLKGRHPEHERARRVDEENLKKRKDERDAVSSEERKRILARQIMIASGIGTALVIAVTVGLFFRSEIARRGRLEQLGDPYRSMGFVVVETGSRGAPGKLETTADQGCFVVASTVANGAITVKQGTNEVSGAGPAFFCTCQNDPIFASAQVPQGGGLALLRIDASAVGGSRAASFLPFKPGAIGRWDASCAETSLDAWLDAKRFPKATVEDTWLKEDPRRSVLADIGFKPLAKMKKDAVIAVVELPAESCIVAAPAKPDDPVGLRAKGGSMLVAPVSGGFAWCTSAEGVFTVQREPSSSEVTVVGGSVARLSGMPGLRELAASAGLTLGTMAVAPQDRGWMAKRVLMTSAIPEALITVAVAPEIPNDPDARLFAVSFASPNALAADTPDGVFSFCEPTLDAKTTDAICAFSGAPSWRITRPDAVGGIARAKLPFWLFAMQGVNEPAGLKGELQLVSLARKLKREGFEPTTLEAVTEVLLGAEVLGRSNEDAIVAVTVSATDPWVFPLSDGAPWTVDGTPKVVPLKPLERVTLTTNDRKLPPKDKRRTVVFRRQKK